MKIYAKIEALLLNCLKLIWTLFVGLHEKKNIRRKRKLYCSEELSQEQKQQIDSYFLENYGKKVPYKWHRLYKSYTGKFDYRYTPEFIYTTKQELLQNKRLDVRPIENKALLKNFVRGMEDVVRIPETYIACVQGCYYDGDGNIISRNKAIELLKNRNNGTYQAICKKTVDTGSGRDVYLMNIKDGIDVNKKESIDSILKSMSDNFVVQEKIKPHPSFSALYSGSVNTLRVISYQTAGGFKVAPIIMRIGRNGFVDNAHAGGVFIGVTEEGRLLKEAFTEYQERYTKRPVSGVEFEGHLLSRVPDIAQVAIQMHKYYPTLKFISWDFTVDANNNIVLIEVNLYSQSIWLAQMAHGCGIFGEDTAEMLQLVSKKKTSQ